MDRFEGTFSFVSTGQLSEESQLTLGWFAVSHHWFSGERDGKSAKKRRRLAYGRWYKILSEDSSAYRVLRFSPQLEFDDGRRGQMVVDRVGWLELSGRPAEEPEEMDLEIRPLKFWERLNPAFFHPDPAYRLASWIALLSLGLGILSLVT